MLVYYSKKRVLCVVGTRPEIIKMAPLIIRLKRINWLKLDVLFTGQHRDIADDTLKVFNITPDYEFKSMSSGQTLSGLMSSILSGIDVVLSNNVYDLILGQGDTTTAFASALYAFYKHYPFGHVEAGLRSFNQYSPFPEEMHRLLISRVASLHFCPTVSSKENLLKEGVPLSKICVSGNTVVDAIRLVSVDGSIREKTTKNLVVTLHRRENFGYNHIKILEILKSIATEASDVNIVFSVHPNPSIRGLVYKVLSGVKNVRLIDARLFPYDKFIKTLKNSYFIITDSGGIQEEAAALRKPTLVFRTETERTEGVDLGVAKILNPLEDDIKRVILKLLRDKRFYNSMISTKCPYGDGNAAERICKKITSFLQK